MAWHYWCFAWLKRAIVEGFRWEQDVGSLGVPYVRWPIMVRLPVGLGVYPGRTLSTRADGP